jgi:hypothetical protein
MAEASRSHLERGFDRPVRRLNGDHARPGIGDTASLADALDLRIRRAAHMIKGTSSILGARELSEQCDCNYSRFDFMAAMRGSAANTFRSN